ncbi:unnamed protein product [Clonostachys chloroleuca]|uniref:Uncharacterized protein n=1 Tax=Clonostachys chloroleuca TaxID=1926264 RepID=A0AA35MCX3_9HYPO|nr:unnamed protein product [Clonostachys chloroleuca]
MADQNASAALSGPSQSPCITGLISSYAILSTLASWLSSADLYHLGLTNRYHHSCILASPALFKKLQRLSLCDGHGLALRQEFKSPYLNKWRRAGRWTCNPGFTADEEIEDFLYNVKCDEAGALPCIKCGINICEECRFYPRAAPPPSYPILIGNVIPRWRRSFRGNFSTNSAIATLTLAGSVLGALWRKREFTRHYFDEHTVWEGNEKETKSFWCLCGSAVPEDTRIRCTWCKRHHLPEDQWLREYEEVGPKLPFFDNNPDYPRWTQGETENT